jgi:hypothetical protein
MQKGGGSLLEWWSKDGASRSENRQLDLKKQEVK